jgi:probable rRNA maturation factor
LFDNFDLRKFRMPVKFFYADRKVRIPNRKRLKAFISTIFREQGFELHSISYVFCSDQYLLRINRDFLKHDDYTDIISFLLSVPPAPIDAEIYISDERVKDNARQLGIPPIVELHRVIFHGALHFCGFNDKKPHDKMRMTHAEDKYLRDYLITH